jgi:hypothetical protein
MIIFPKKDIVPIIAPQILFKDKYNNINNYIEMNPSMYIDDKGNVTILVRCVNYRKFMEKQFTLYDKVSNSIFSLIKGKLNHQEKLHIEEYDYKLLNCNYNLPIYPTLWKGLEDIRFIDEKNILVIVPELNCNGNPSIFKAEINDTAIENFIVCKPNNIEKNWMPYLDNSNNTNNSTTNKVIYSLHPFIIKSIENDDFEEIELKENIKHKLHGYHGSTNGIILNNYERLFLIHINREKTSHRWLIFNIKTKNVIVSDEFVFFKNSYIEFNCSLVKYEDRIFVTIGVNDDKAYIIETCNDDIINTFSGFHFDKLNELNESNETNQNNESNELKQNKYPTIVTMLYDIRSMENNKIERNRKLESYIDFSKKFLLKLPYPIVFFIDDNCETYDAIYNARKELGLLDNTYIYVCDFKTTYFYKYLTKLEKLQTQFHIKNGEIEHETPLYVILNNNKFDCIEKTIQLNPFNSSHFIWMDFGINHVALDTDRIHEWFCKVPDKIKQLCINPYVENIQPKNYFELIYHNMAGGLFSGSKENMLLYADLFKAKTEQIYNEGWYQIDEAVMTMVHRENPDLFDLFYGDYQGIVSNYLSPIHNLDLILKGAQKCISMNKTKEAFHILSYCSDYFMRHPDHHLLYSFIQQNIIVDYYWNNKLLLQSVIDLINLKLNSNNENDKINIHAFLENNKANINFYENKELIQI